MSNWPLKLSEKNNMRQTDKQIWQQAQIPATRKGKKKKQKPRTKNTLQTSERLETAAFSWLQCRALERACPAFLIFLFSENFLKGSPSSCWSSPWGEVKKRTDQSSSLAQWNLLPLITKTSTQQTMKNSKHENALLMLDFCMQRGGEI